MTQTAVQEWIQRNDHYHAAVETYRGTHALNEYATQSERFDHLIDCLISMARSDTSGEIDADIQVALAILMNTNGVSCTIVTRVRTLTRCSGTVGIRESH